MFRSVGGILLGLGLVGALLSCGDGGDPEEGRINGYAEQLARELFNDSPTVCTAIESTDIWFGNVGVNIEAIPEEYREAAPERMLDKLTEICEDES